MKKVLYLRVEVDAPEDSDPVQSLSDAATWAEYRLNSGEVKAEVTAYSSAADLVLDEAE